MFAWITFIDMDMDNVLCKIPSRDILSSNIISFLRVYFDLLPPMVQFLKLLSEDIKTSQRPNSSYG